MIDQVDEQKLIDDELEAELAAELAQLARTIASTSPDSEEKEEEAPSEVIDCSPAAPDQAYFLSTAELNRIKAEQAPPVSDADQEGWRIARQAMVREFMVFSTRAVLGIALVGIVGMALFVGIQKARQIDPRGLITFASQIFPVLKQVDLEPPATTTVVEPVKVDNSGHTAPRSPRRIAVRPRKALKKRHIAQAAARRGGGGYWGMDAPTGGSITYADGTLTEYTWH